MVKTSVADATRAWAAGSYPVAAGVELLIHAGLLGENVPRRVAACLLGGPPVDLADTVTSLDRAED